MLSMLDIHGLNGYSVTGVTYAQWGMFSATITLRWNVFPQFWHVLYLDCLCAYQYGIKVIIDEI